MKRIVSLFVVMLLLVYTGMFGCTRSQVQDISIISVDTMLLNDAVTTARTNIVEISAKMDENKRNEVMATLGELDKVQLKIKSYLSLGDLMSVPPGQLMVTYMEAKNIAERLRGSLYDKDDNFAVWNTISPSSQLQLQTLNEQSLKVGAEIETYLKNPDNTDSIKLATELATYGYLAFKVMSIGLQATGH